MALWDAGHERIARESRERLAELFVTSRDAALDVLVTSGQAKPRGAWHLPSYIKPTGVSVRPTGSPAQRDRALAQLAIQFPGIVKRTDS